MTADEQYFLTESVTHARTLPLGQCAAYLRVLSTLCEDTPLVDQLRGVAHDLTESDAQLALFASGQMRLPLADSHTDRTPQGAD